MVKAGDQVWDPTSQRERIVASVDDETNEVAFTDGDGWVPACVITVQRVSDHESHRRALVNVARDGGRRGVVARRTLARLWSDGKLGSR